MRHLFLSAALALTAAPAAAQTAFPPPEPTVETPAAAEDGATVDSLIAAVYGVISGDAGQARDWDRFRALFHPSARLIPVGQRASGEVVATPATPDDYIARSEPALMQGFHEREIARRAVTFGRIAHVWSTYEGRRTLSDAQPLVRGVNTFQLWNDGRRWWVMNLMWQAETPTTPLPPEYLPTP